MWKVLNLQNISRNPEINCKINMKGLSHISFISEYSPWLNWPDEFMLFFSFFFSFFFFFNFIFKLYNIVLFCQISKWIRHRYTCVPHPEPSSLLPPHTIPLGHPSALAPSIQYRASNLDWRLVPYMILYVFLCHSPKSSHPLPLPQSPKDCSIHQCLFCCFTCT